MNGGRIQQLDVHDDLNIKFRDSLNYNPQALAKWPATFGLPDLAKGTFPHRFNRPENWNAELPLPYPALEEFGYRYLNEKDKQVLKNGMKKIASARITSIISDVSLRIIAEWMSVFSVSAVNNSEPSSWKSLVGYVLLFQR